MFVKAKNYGAKPGPFIEFELKSFHDLFWCLLLADLKKNCLNFTFKYI